MAKIAFDIKYRTEIESGEYKVETKDGFPATILDWSFRKDSGSPYICVKITKGGEDNAFLYSEDGKRAVHRVKDNELIIITPESEDEKMRKGLIHHLKELREWKVGTMSPIKVEEYYDAWIAYLEKQEEQKPAEWSEEDEEMRWNLINAFTDKNNSRVDEFMQNRASKAEVIDWLKSLRPSWKPSEEQMTALEYFIRSWGESGTMSPQNLILCAAKSLYNDLKKL